MKIKREEIIHLAKLSNLSLSEKEVEGFEGELENIIEYISQLDEVDTENIEPTYQVFEMKNVWREDQIISQDASCEELLKLSQDSSYHQIKVPKVL